MSQSQSRRVASAGREKQALFVLRIEHTGERYPVRLGTFFAVRSLVQAKKTWVSNPEAVGMDLVGPSVHGLHF